MRNWETVKAHRRKQNFLVAFLDNARYAEPPISSRMTPIWNSMCMLYISLHWDIRQHGKTGKSWYQTRIDFACERNNILWSSVDQHLPYPTSDTMMMSSKVSTNSLRPLIIVGHNRADKKSSKNSKTLYKLDFLSTILANSPKACFLQKMAPSHRLPAYRLR